MPRKNEGFRFAPFSTKQKQVLTWWLPTSPVKDYDALICDGSVRAGKTLAMSLGYVQWAMASFDQENFGMAGKTIAALHRNVVEPLKPLLASLGYRLQEHLAKNRMTIAYQGASNEFYWFGGKDESSSQLIQGITLAGMFFDEIALMPESFVNQATARCSVDGAKFWMNCNPEGPYHWFKQNWLDDLRHKNALHLHFTMEDNWSLSQRVKDRFKTLYRGMFYERFILGRWVAAEGLIYDMFDRSANTYHELPVGLAHTARRYIGIDYGTQNATVFLECYDDGHTLWIDREYYYSGRTTGQQKDDSAYAQDLDTFCGDKPFSVILDPSAASFKATLRAHGYRTMDAKNDVHEGIERVATLFTQRRIKIHLTQCPNLLQELAGYVWDDKAVQRGDEKPVKQNDHACDALRYLSYTIVSDYRAHRATSEGG